MIVAVVLTLYAADSVAPPMPHLNLMFCVVGATPCSFDTLPGHCLQPHSKAIYAIPTSLVSFVFVPSHHSLFARFLLHPPPLAHLPIFVNKFS